MKLYTGGNKFLAIIDLNENFINKFQLKNNKGKNERTVYSAIEINNKNSNSSFYIVGTYSSQIYLIDKRDNIHFEVLFGHQNGINKIKFLKDEIHFLSGSRKENYVNLWDIRNTRAPIKSFYRSGNTNQKLEFDLNANEENLFIANDVLFCLLIFIINNK
jgi:WD40 repeat protein